MKPSAAVLALAAVASAAIAAPYRLPPEPAIALPPGPGVELVQAHCSACHSLDYITTQPPAMGQAFWADTIAKMIKTYGAEIPADHQAAIIAYLARKDGLPK
jgi:sulfite dehydrogenase (cytochrome) subunit B